jgi:hypothetical protein
MAIYNTGAVKVRVGSALVTGVGGTEDFVTYGAVGYLFKLTGEPTWYQIAGITNATNFTLSARYVNSSYQTLRSAEHTATMTVATRMYSGALNFYPAIQNAVSFVASGETFTDNGGGVLAGDGSPAGSGTVDYDTGAWAITLGTDLTGTAEMTASYSSGDTRTGMPYQLAVDYTPNYDVPEMSLNDINFPHIYTKGVRILDAQIKTVSDAVGVTVVPVDHTTATEVTLTSSDLNKTHLFSNTATCVVTMMSVSVTNAGQWIEFRKKGAGDLEINMADSDTVMIVGDTQVSHYDAAPTFDFLKLLLESATHWGCGGFYGPWETS